MVSYLSGYCPCLPATQVHVHHACMHAAGCTVGIGLVFVQAYHPHLHLTRCALDAVINCALFDCAAQP